MQSFLLKCEKHGITAFNLRNKCETEMKRLELEYFTIEMSFVCTSEDKTGKKRNRSHSCRMGLAPSVARQVFVTQAAEAATSRLATELS